MASLRQQIATTALTLTKFRDLMKRMQENRPQDDLTIVKKAYDYSLKNHEGQSRASGEPYLVHPLEVALVLAEMKMDPVAVAAGLLHDSVEDTSVTIVDIRKEFGEQVAHIVEGVTKISKIDFATREEQQAENLRKMMLAMVDDIRVVLIKLADRLHNMRTLEHLPPDRQHKIAEETLEIYAPIAHRLGMGKIRGELEDLGFRFLDPVGYEQVEKSVNARRKEGEAFLAKMQQTITDKLKEAGIQARVESRIKRLFSIHKKLQRQRISVDQVYDLCAMRVITRSLQDCYAVLGIIHNLWRPVPGRIKDFIAMPRPNFYQSLHTSVITEDGTPFEIQIRTEEMHKMAEEGIAAHWKYKDGPVSAQDEQRLAWLRQVVEWQRDVSDPNEFLSTLKVDLYPEEVYTFTPKGKVVVLPRDATPVDFAYSVHTEVGHTCIGAKVNGRMVPLRHKLHSGDIVEILTQPGHKPSRDWLGLVKSSRSRNKIKHWLNVHQRERAIEIGRKLIEKEARKYRIALKEIKDEDLQKVASGYGLGKADDLMSGIGYGKYSARQVSGPPAARWGDALHCRRHRIRGPDVATRRHCQRRAPRLRRSQRHHRPRARRHARLSRPLLQSHSRRRHRRLHHARQRRGRALDQLPQRDESSLRTRTQDRCRVGPRREHSDRLSGEADRLLRRPLRHAEEHYRSDRRRQEQHPQHHRAHLQQPGQR